MKWINRAIALSAVLALSAVAAWAQTQECTDEFKTAKYTEWYENRKDNQDVAYKAAKDYVTACPTAEDTYATTLKKFIADYDRIHVDQKLAKDFQAAVTAKNYVEQIRLGKQLVAMPNNADNAVIYIIMAGAGLGDANLLPDAGQAAKKAVELIDGGKPFTPAYQTKDQALAAMNYVIAKSTVKTSPTDAIPYFIKAAKYESDLKKSWVLYNELADAYGEGPVAKLTEDYKKFIGQPESDASKLVLANLNQALDRQIDAFARAAALNNNATEKKQLMEVLAAVYKDRNKTDPDQNALNALVASALSKPLPDAPTPITTLPAAGPSPTPVGGSGSSVGSSAPGMSNANKPAGSSPAANTGNGSATGTQTSGSAKPASTPKPKPRRANHRGR